MLDLSVVIPIRNEAPSLVELHRELSETLRAWGEGHQERLSCALAPDALTTPDRAA